MKNPLDSLWGTVISGLVLTVVLYYLARMAFGKLASHRSVVTGLPVSAWKVAGVTNFVAASVIATWTSTLFLCRSLASSATL